MLTKDAILGAVDSAAEAVEVPEWKGTVYIRVMSGTERDAFEGSVTKDGKVTVENIRAKLLVKTLSDETGKRLFTDADLAALGAKSGRVLDRLFAEAKRVNGMTKNDVEELVKNS